MLQFEKIYPLDAAFDTYDEIPEDLRESRRYKDVGDCSVDGLAKCLVADFGEHPLDILVHSLANGPEVKKPLLETSRAGYLAAVSVSAYSLVAMLQRLGPLMRPGGSALSLTYMASERTVPGYGGGMSSAKAALESDTRTLAFEAGRKWGFRVNTISAGPYASRAASAIGIIEQDGRVRGAQRAPHCQARRRRSRSYSGVSEQRSGFRHHRHHDLCGQRLSRHGHGGGRRLTGVSRPPSPLPRSPRRLG